MLLFCFLFCFSDFRSYPSPNLPRISKTSSGDLVRSSSGSRFRGSLGGKSKPKKCKAKCKPWKKVLCELVCRILYWNARSGLVHQMNMDITWHASDYNLSLQKCYTFKIMNIKLDRFWQKISCSCFSQESIDLNLQMTNFLRLWIAKLLIFSEPEWETNGKINISKRTFCQILFNNSIL